MPSTTESGLTTKRTRISAAKFMGREEGDALGKVGQDSDKAGSLPHIVRSNKKAIAINARKITLLKNIENLKKDPIGDKLPGGGGSLKDILGSVATSMDGIRDTLIAKNQVDADEAEDARKASEKAVRGKKEKDLEDKFEGLKGVARKVLAPVQSVWEKILKFITTIFLGKLAMKVFKWFADPENKEKVEAIGRFFEDYWPALLIGYVAFGTALGRFVVGLGAKLVSWTATIVWQAIPALVTAAKAMGPWGVGALAVLGIGGAAYGISKMLGKDKVVENETKRADTSRKGLEEAESTKDLSPGDREALVQGTRPRDAGGGGTLNNMRDQFNDPLGVRQDPTGLGGGLKFNQGGSVPGRGPNKDTVPAMLTPGEFVMSVPAVQKWGLSTLEGMNAAGGGTNKPKKDNDGVTYANDGGWISGLFGGKKDSNNAQGSLKGLTMKDYKDLAFIVSGEAQRGTSDEYGVAANVLNRVADPRYPDTIKAVGAEPGQYEAVFKGKAYDDPELAVKLASPAGQAGILSALQRLQGRTDFKGTSQYKNMGEGDVKFSPRGNFYHYAEQVVKSDPPPKQIPTHWKKFVGSGGGVGATQSMSILGGNGGVGSTQSMSTPGSSGGSTPANVSAPPPVTSINPPSKGKVSSVVAYAQQKGQSPAGQNARPLPSTELPQFDAAIMNSPSKIKTLGITV